MPKLPLNVKLPDSTTQALQDPVATTTQDVHSTVDNVTQTVGGVLKGIGAGG